MHKCIRKITAIALMLCCIFSVMGCGSESVDDRQDETYNITDSEGHVTGLKKNGRVVALYGSFAEMWELSGGSLVGVTEDAIDERHMEVGDAKIVGSVKDPNLEIVTSLNPDYVILSKDLTAHQSLKASLEQLHINYGYFEVDTFDDYEWIMSQFCGINERSDLYEANVVNVKAQIEQVKADVLEKKNENNLPRVLLIRAYTTGVKAKSDDNLAGVILKEFGCVNIVDEHPSMLEDLSVEQIIKENPDYIFVLTMGDETKALAYLDTNVLSNPAWSGLSAVKNGRYVVLPKELFHYKPNNRWGESYSYLADILF